MVALHIFWCVSLFMSDKLIILADRGELKAYKLTRSEMDTTPRLELLEGFATVDGHGRIVDKVSDLAGCYPVSSGNGHATAASTSENHNLRTELEKRALKVIVEGINELVRREKSPMWYFAAPKEINQRIVEQLDGEVRSRMKKNVGSDLLKTDKAHLLTHFA